MEKEFIPYEQALALKELGFDEPCCANMFDYTKPHINTDVPNRIRYFMPNYSENFNKEYDFGVVGHKDIFVSIPIYQQAFRWFREKYQIDSWIYPNLNGLYSVSNVRRGVGLGKVSEYQTYEEAELECLKKLIEIVKNK
jgi:hypothetical protein